MKVSSSSWLAGAISVGVIILAATTGSSAQTQTHLDPATGRDCVLETSATRESDSYIRFRYHNSCGLRFSISVYADGQRLASTSIAPYGDDSIVISESRVQGRSLTWDFE